MSGYNGDKGYIWFIRAGTCRQESNTNNECEKNMKSKVMKL
nr:hypothetical protein [Candidatus Enterovibrio escacola]